MPETNADAFTELGRHRVIPEGLAGNLAGAAGFRNVLVHQYAEVADELVVDNLSRLGDLADLVREVGFWLPGE